MIKLEGGPLDGKILKNKSVEKTLVMLIEMFFDGIKKSYRYEKVGTENGVSIFKFRGRQ